MAFNDSLSDMLARIKNAHLARKSFTSCLKSKLNMNVLAVLKDEGYIRDYKDIEIKKGINSILCVGETGDQRKTGKTFEIIEQQLCIALAGLEKQDLQNVSIAYEPVWAIGTGKNATEKQMEEVHIFIREVITNKLFGKEINPLTILYGGSVTPQNCKKILANKEVDGALVGTASLNIDSFCAIISSAKSV